MDATCLSLPEALVEWSRSDLVEAIRLEESKFSQSVLASTARFTLASILDVRSTPLRWQFQIGGLVGIETLNRTWEQLLGAFRLELERGHFRLEATETFMTTKRVAFGPDQASQLVIDPPSGAVFVGMRTFTGATVFRTCAPVHVSRAHALAKPLGSLTPERGSGGNQQDDAAPMMSGEIDVASLEPEVVAKLLEQHAEHVRVGLRVSLALPGKASCIALIASMMKHRKEQGELRESLAEEAGWLERWAKSAAPSYFCPGKKAISNKLRPLYNDLKKGGPSPSQ